MRYPQNVSPVILAKTLLRRLPPSFSQSIFIAEFWICGAMFESWVVGELFSKIFILPIQGGRLMSTWENLGMASWGNLTVPILCRGVMTLTHQSLKSQRDGDEIWGYAQLKRVASPLPYRKKKGTFLLEVENQACMACAGPPPKRYKWIQSVASRHRQVLSLGRPKSCIQSVFAARCRVTMRWKCFLRCASVYLSVCQSVLPLLSLITDM